MILAWLRERRYQHELARWSRAAMPPTPEEKAADWQRQQRGANIKWALIVAIAWGCAMALTLLASALHIPLN